MQVEKAVVSYTGVEPATDRVKAIALPTELVCKLFRLGHEVQITVGKVDSQ